MKLEFDITQQEMMAFQRRALERNGQFRRSILRVKIIVPLFLAILVFMSVDLTEDGKFQWSLVVAVLVVVAVFTAFFYLIFRRLAVWGTMKRVSRTMASPKNSVYFKRRVMEIGDDGISIDTEDSSDRLNWSLIQEYEELQTVFLLYISEISAHLIPKRALSEEEISGLRALLDTHVAPLTENKNKK